MVVETALRDQSRADCGERNRPKRDLKQNILQRLADNDAYEEERRHRDEARRTPLVFRPFVTIQETIEGADQTSKPGCGMSNASKETVGIAGDRLDRQSEQGEKQMIRKGGEQIVSASRGRLRSPCRLHSY